MSSTRTTWSRVPFALLLGYVLLVAVRPCLAQPAIPIVIEGQVTDALGRPLSGVTVAVGHDESTTDAAGKFHLALAAGPGSVVVKAFLKDHPEAQETRRIEVTAADTGDRKFTVVFVLAPPSRGSGAAGRDRTHSARSSTASARRPRADSMVPAPPPPPPPAPEPPPPPPAPATVGADVPAPPPLTSADRAIVRVLYATDRKPSGKTTTYDYYTGESLRGGNLQYGACDVSIPILHERGKFESPSIWRFEQRETRGKHIVVLTIVPTDRGSFLSELHQELQKDPDGQLLVFVHGFNVSFNEAARRTAQVAYDLEFKGAPVLYSWPSKGELTAYAADEATVDSSWRNFQSFLTDLALHTHARRIFVLAHSMGSRLVARAIDGMVQNRSLSTLPVFTQVVLAAPDIDTRELDQLAATLKSASGRVTVYANSHDEAIKASSKVHRAPRAGSSGNDIFLADGVDSIDATDTDTGFLQHSYYANAILLNDLSRLFRENAPPPRAGMTRQVHGNQVFWVLEPR